MWASNFLKTAIQHYTPNIVKNNLAWGLSLFGDALMTIPLEAYVFNGFFDAILNDDESDGIEYDEGMLYAFTAISLFILVYPGQMLIAYDKNKSIVNDFFGYEQNNSLINLDVSLWARKLIKSSAVGVVSISSGVSAYLLVDSLSDNKKMAILYSANVIFMNVVFRTLFFNSDNHYQIPFEFNNKIIGKIFKFSCKGISWAYALTAATPFAAGYLAEDISKTEKIILLAMLSCMTYGEYIRMEPGLSNLFKLLESKDVKTTKFQNAICYISALLRTGLTMYSVNHYPGEIKYPIWAALTPGVGLFQMASCMPVSFEEKIDETCQEIEMETLVEGMYMEEDFMPANWFVVDGEKEGHENTAQNVFGF